jgi:hypothetical protein
MDPSTSDLPLMVEAPDDDSLLPAQVVAWDGCPYTAFERSLPVNVPVSTNVGTFQRAAQAATLLNRAHIWAEKMRRSLRLPGVAEFQDIDIAIRSMISAMLAQCQKWEVFCDSFAMCVRSVALCTPPSTQPLSMAYIACLHLRALPFTVPYSYSIAPIYSRGSRETHEPICSC